MYSSRHSDPLPLGQKSSQALPTETAHQYPLQFLTKSKCSGHPRWVSGGMICSFPEVKGEGCSLRPRQVHQLTLLTHDLSEKTKNLCNAFFIKQPEWSFNILDPGLRIFQWFPTALWIKPKQLTVVSITQLLLSSLASSSTPFPLLPLDSRYAHPLKKKKKKTLKALYHVHCSMHFSCVISLNPANNFMRWVLSWSPFYRHRNWCRHRLSNLPKITPLTAGKAGVQSPCSQPVHQ